MDYQQLANALKIIPQMIVVRDLSIGVGQYAVHLDFIIMFNKNYVSKLVLDTSLWIWFV